MDRLRKFSLPALFAFASLFGVLVLQSSHHHPDPSSDHQHRSDCSVCSWQQSSSHATSATVAFTTFLASVPILGSIPEAHPTVLFALFPPGRSPPNHLL